MPLKSFVGRKIELSQLEELSQSGRSTLAIIKGRRRIGKSRLVAEFAKGKTFLSFSGIAPVKGITGQEQRDIFARQFFTQFRTIPLSFLDWYDAFLHLSEKLTNEPTVILLDEISWMGSEDPTFLPKIKLWWDSISEKKSNITLIMCGSVSTWIEANIINSTAFQVWSGPGSLSAPSPMTGNRLRPDVLSGSPAQTRATLLRCSRWSQLRNR